MARTSKPDARMKAYTKERMALKRLNKHYKTMTKDEQKAYDQRFMYSLAEKQAIHQLKVEKRRASKLEETTWPKTMMTAKLPEANKLWDKDDSKLFNDFLKLSEEEVAALVVADKK
jgi:predicted secreted protein